MRGQRAGIARVLVTASLPFVLSADDLEVVEQENGVPADVAVVELHQLERLRIAGSRARCVVVANQGEALVAFTAGADDVVTRPVNARELVARLQAILRRTVREPPPTLRAGELVLDSARGEVVFHGVQIGLTATELRVLRLLMEHPGEVVSKRQILFSVWSDSERSSNLVETYVGALRRKLATAGAQPIRTVRQAGYLLEAGVPATRPERTPGDSPPFSKS